MNGRPPDQQQDVERTRSDIEPMGLQTWNLTGYCGHGFQAVARLASS